VWLVKCESANFDSEAQYSLLCLKLMDVSWVDKSRGLYEREAYKDVPQVSFALSAVRY